MKPWVGLLQARLPEWITEGEYTPGWVDHHVFGYSRSQYYTYIVPDRKVGEAADFAMEAMTDIISTYILPYFPGVDDIGNGLDSANQTHRTYASYYEADRNKFSEVLRFIRSYNPDTVYLPEVVARLKKMYPEAIIDALEIKTTDDSADDDATAEKETETVGESSTLSPFVIFIIMLVLLWILDE